MTNINLLPKDLRSKKHYRTWTRSGEREIGEPKVEQVSEDSIVEPIVEEVEKVEKPPIKIIKKPLVSIKKEPVGNLSVGVEDVKDKIRHRFSVSSFYNLFSKKQQRQDKPLPKKTEFKLKKEKKTHFSKLGNSILPKKLPTLNWNKIKNWLKEDISIQKAVTHKKHINFIHSLHRENKKPFPVRNIHLQESLRLEPKESIKVLKEPFRSRLKQPLTRKIKEWFLSDIRSIFYRFTARSFKINTTKIVIPKLTAQNKGVLLIPNTEQQKETRLAKKIAVNKVSKKIASWLLIVRKFLYKDILLPTTKKQKITKKQKSVISLKPFASSLKSKLAFRKDFFEKFIQWFNTDTKILSFTDSAKVKAKSKPHKILEPGASPVLSSWLASEVAIKLPKFPKLPKLPIVQWLKGNVEIHVPYFSTKLRFNSEKHDFISAPAKIPVKTNEAPKIQPSLPPLPSEEPKKQTTHKLEKEEEKEIELSKEDKLKLSEIASQGTKVDLDKKNKKVKRKSFSMIGGKHAMPLLLIFTKLFSFAKLFSFKKLKQLILPSSSKDTQGFEVELLQEDLIGIRSPKPEIVKLLFAIGVVLAISGLISGYYLYLFEQRVLVSTEVQRRLDLLNATIFDLQKKQAELKEPIAYLSTISIILDQRMNWNKVLEALESVTLKNVYYTGIDIDSELLIKLSARTETLEDMEAQIQILKTQDFIEDIISNSYALMKGKSKKKDVVPPSYITFSLTIRFKKEFFIGKR